MSEEQRIEAARLRKLAIEKSRTKEHATAVELFERLLKIESDSSSHFNLGTQYYALGKLVDARKSLVAALKLDPRLLRGHLLLALVYSKEGKESQSENYLRNALKLDPDNTIANRSLCVSLSTQGRFEESLELTERLLAKLPGDEALRTLRAGLLLQLKRLHDSLGEYRELTQKASGFTSFTDHLNSARTAADQEYSTLFSGMEEKIDERTDRLREKLTRHKKSGEAVEKEDLKDMVDLSLLHLFKGDTDKALRFLFQAQKLGRESGQSGKESGSDADSSAPTPPQRDNGVT